MRRGFVISAVLMVACGFALTGVITPSMTAQVTIPIDLEMGATPEA